jgi:hypothetical protein
MSMSRSPAPGEAVKTSTMEIAKLVMTRGVLIVDENLYPLRSYLEQRNLKVYTPQAK